MAAPEPRVCPMAVSHDLVRLLIVPILLGLSPIAKAAPTPAAAELPSRKFASALAEAAAFCEKVVTAEDGIVVRPTGTQFYMDIPKKVGKTHSLLELPARVTMFSRTQPLSSVQPLSAAVLFPATDGEAWVLMFGSLPVCDVLITRSEDARAAVAALAADRAARGWELVTRRPPKAVPSAEYFLVKRLPKQSKLDFGISLRMRAFTTRPGASDANQGALNFAAGGLTVTRVPR